MSDAKRGLYLALEGVEGVGKSTVADELVALLQGSGIEVLMVREPGGTPTGEKIRRVLLEPEGSVAPWAEALLFSAARAQLAAEVVEPALRSGTWVVSDRSVYSSLAYQGYGRQLGIGAVRAVNEPGLGPTWPDLVALLRMDVDAGLARQQVPDRIGAAGREFLGKVAEGFNILSAMEPGRFVVVDAAMPVKDVAAVIAKAATDRHE
jgi:dTMP kinase